MLPHRSLSNLEIKSQQLYGMFLTFPRERYIEGGQNRGLFAKDLTSLFFQTIYRSLVYKVDPHQIVPFKFTLPENHTFHKNTIFLL